MAGCYRQVKIKDKYDNAGDLLRDLHAIVADAEAAAIEGMGRTKDMLRENTSECSFPGYTKDTLKRDNAILLDLRNTLNMFITRISILVEENKERDAQLDDPWLLGVDIKS